MGIDWAAIWQAITSDTAQKVYAAIGGGLAVIIKTWWDRRDHYQASVGWKHVNGMYGPDDVPVLTIVNTSDKPLSVTSVRLFNGWRWQLDGYPFDSDDPDYPTMPRIVAKGESTIFMMSAREMDKAVKQSGPVLRFLRLPRVYVGVITMGRGRRLFVGEWALNYDVRYRRYR